LGEVILQDNFEAENLNDAPANWINIDPGSPGTTGVIVQDPQDAANQVMEITALDAANVLVADMDELMEYTAEWDWMWESGWQTIAIHTQPDGARYHLSVDTDGGNWEMWSWDAGNWGGAFVVGDPAQEVNVWHRFQLTVNQAHITLKAKPRDEATPFDALDPVLEMNGENAAYTRGRFGFADGPVSYIDNVMIYVGSPASVSSNGKLSTAWGDLKRY
jgi:hypothetical protein